MIKSEIVAHSLSPQGNELISVLCTFPRIILAEVNTHRMLSKNTSSSRAIPLEKMLKSVEDNPFIPLAWQKPHKGMQGIEYETNLETIEYLKDEWLQGAWYARTTADIIGGHATKQLANRLLEPFMWTTMLITGSKQGWDNFFHLRCPDYVFHTDEIEDDFHFRSRKEVIKQFGEDEEVEFDSGNVKLKDLTDIQWLQINYGQAEIHMMTLAEAIWDSLQESEPERLEAGDWHIPFKNVIAGSIEKYKGVLYPMDEDLDEITYGQSILCSKAVKISTAMSARTSYTVVGDEKEIDLEKMIELHDRLVKQTPPHSSPLEHCAQAMTDDQHFEFRKGQLSEDTDTGLLMPIDEESAGWCFNLKGFISYRYMVDNGLV